MATLSFDEVRATPEKLDPFLKQGKTVTITKDGKPYFEAVPATPLVRRHEFDRKIDELWAGTGVEYSNEQIVDLIRRSRGEDRSL